MVAIFKPVAVPETCYVLEAVYWLAFARFPDFIGNEDGDEGRRYGEAEYYGRTVSFDWGFREREFALAGVEIEYDRYLEGVELYSRLTGAEYIESRTSWLCDSGPAPEKADVKPTYDDGDPYDRDPFASFAAGRESRPSTLSTPQEIASLKAEIIRENADSALEADWVIEQEQSLDPIIDAARARVFLALSEGKLSATGWRKFSDDELEANGGRAKSYEGGFEEIAASEWGWRRFDWQSSRLVAPKRVYDAVQIDTADLLTMFPEPAVPAIPMKMILYGNVLMPAADQEIDDDVKASVSRGRPGKTIAVKDALVNWFKIQLRKGDAPEKAEALITEAQAFAADVLGVTMARSSMQNYLNEVRSLTAPMRFANKAAE